MIFSHLPLVKHLACRILAEVPPGTDVENLEAAGVLGLVESASKFDASRAGVQFKTFAYTRIRGAILDELRRNCPLPQHVMTRVKAVREARSRLNPPVRVSDLVRETGFSEDEVIDALTAIRLTRMSSWEQASAEKSVDVAESGQSPVAAAERSEQLTLLADAIQALPERQRLIVTLYYKQDLRLKEIKEVVGLSEARISRLLSKALFELGELLGGVEDVAGQLAAR